MRLTRALGVALAFSVVVLTGFTLVPSAQAAKLPRPSWVPVKLARPASSMSGAEEAFWLASMGIDMDANSPGRYQADNIEGLRAMRAAAKNGAYIPGVSEAAKTLGKSPLDVTEAEAGERFASYRSRPGANSLMAATANSKGVVSITNVGANGARFAKAGAAFAAVSRVAGVAGLVVGAAQVGVSAGTAIAQVTGLPTTGDFICDLQAAFSSSGCGFAPDPAYTVNSDVLDVVPGIVGTSTVELPASRWRVDGYSAYGPTPPLLMQMTVREPGTAPVDRVTVDRTLSVSNPSWAFADPATPLPWLLQRAVCGTDPVPALGGTASGTAGSSDLKVAVLTFTASSPCAAGKVLSAVVFVKGSVTNGGLVSSGPVIGIWYPQWSPLRPVDVAADPARRWITEWQCTDGTGGGKQSQAYHESDEYWPTPPPADCTGGGQVKSLKITQTTEGMPNQVVYEWTLPEETKDFVDTYPQCVHGECVLDLFTTKTGTRTSCFDQPDLCTNWLTEVKENHSTDYACEYAGKSVAITECYLYGPTFDRKKVEKKAIYGDPKTGADPVPATPVDPNAAPDPSAQPDADENCPPPFSWGALFNNWWIYKAAGCAIQDAFVPDSVIVTQKINTVRTTASGRPPFSIVTAVTAPLDGMKQGWTGGCTELPDFDPKQQGRLQLPCSPPGGLGFSTVYTLATIAIVGGTIFALWHMAAAAMSARATGE